MRSKLVAVLLALLGQPLWAGDFYQRPTADVDGGSTGVCHANAGTGPNYNASSSASTVYFGKSGAGPTGSGADIGISGGDPFPDYLSRTFNTWQSEQPGPVSLTLNVNTQCSISDAGDSVGGTCYVFYSVNGGSSWATLYSFSSSTTDSDAQTTHSVSVTGYALTGVQVNVCVVANRDSPGNGNGADMQTFDIWTTEVVPNSGFPGVIRSGLEAPWWVEHPRVDTARYL
jgi:hypothetical protein